MSASIAADRGSTSSAEKRAAALRSMASSSERVVTGGSATCASTAADPLVSGAVDKRLTANRVAERAKHRRIIRVRRCRRRRGHLVRAERTHATGSSRRPCSFLPARPRVCWMLTCTCYPSIERDTQVSVSLDSESNLPPPATASPHSTTSRLGPERRACRASGPLRTLVEV